MDNSITLTFIAVEKNNLALPIKDWMNEIGDLLQNAYDNMPASGLFMV